MYRLLTKLLAPAVIAAGCCLSFPVLAADLSEEEAKSIMYDTFTISEYTGLNGESDYAQNHGSIILAALFGAFDAKMGFAYDQECRRENGEEPLPKDLPLFTVAGRSLAPSAVVLRGESPEFFTGMPEQYTALVSREAVELAALRYTGHAVLEHRVPDANTIFSDIALTDRGYLIGVDGLGDIPMDIVLKAMSREKDGYILRGELIDYNAEDGEPDTFTLALYPGDAPGTWKRQYEDTRQPDSQPFVPAEEFHGRVEDYMSGLVHLTVTGTNVRLRKGPGTSHDVVGVARESGSEWLGELIATEEKTPGDGRLWYNVVFAIEKEVDTNYAEKDAWICADFVKESDLTQDDREGIESTAFGILRIPSGGLTAFSFKEPVSLRTGHDGSRGVMTVPDGIRLAVLNGTDAVWKSGDVSWTELFEPLGDGRIRRLGCLPLAELEELSGHDGGQSLRNWLAKARHLSHPSEEHPHE